MLEACRLLRERMQGIVVRGSGLSTELGKDRLGSVVTESVDWRVNSEHW